MSSIQNDHRPLGLPRRVFRVACLFTVLYSSGPTATPAQEREIDNASLMQMIRAWQMRQANMSSISVRWTETRTDRKYSMTHPTDHNRKLPESDTTYEGSNDLLLVDTLSRYNYQGNGLRQVGDDFIYASRFFSIANDGNESRTFSKTDDDVDQVPVGTISQSSKNPDSVNAAYLPLRWFCRPLDPEMGGFNADHLTLKDENVDLQGMSCLLVHELGQFNASLWVARDLEYNIVKVVIPAGASAPTITFDIDYQRDDDVLAPSEWSFRRHNPTDGKERVVCENKVTSLAINPKLDPDAFTIAFPPKTLVTDQLANATHLILEDGSRRAILPKHSGVSYAELKASSEPVRAEFVQELPGGRVSTFTLLTIGSILVISTFVIWYMSRKARR